MRVGLLALDFAPGRSGGIETYLRNLVGALRSLPAGEDRLEVVCLRGAGALLGGGGGALAVRELPFARPSPGWLVRRALLRLGGPDLAAGRVNRLGLDVVHHPLATINTPGLAAPAVLSAGDLQHELFPENFDARELAFRRRAYPASVAAAARVIAMSAHVKGTLVERYGVDPGKVDVVHHGAPPEFRPVEDPAALAAVRARHRLERPFLYYPAASWPHKNHLALLQALRLLLDRGRFDGDLVLSGMAAGAEGRIEREIARLRLRDRVRRLGWLPARELPALYSAADALVFPSLFEGFGIPVLEAMACGCPVVCADAAALPEVAGDAALLFDPRSPEELADRVAKALEPGPRRALREAGLARVAGFGWERAARETLAVYRKVAALRGGAPGQRVSSA